MRKPLLFLLMFAACSASAGVQADLREGGKLYEEQKYGQALSKYNEILRSSPQNEDASFGAGAAAYYLKDYGTAESAFKQAVRQEGKLQQDALFNLGNAYYRAGDKQRAKEVYRQVILKNPNDKEAVHNLQLILEEQQNQNDQNNQNNQNQNKNSPNQSGGGNDDKNASEGQQQNSAQDKENKDAAQRVMQMARENEYKKPQAAGAAQDDTVEKDW